MMKPIEKLMRALTVCLVAVALAMGGAGLSEAAPALAAQARTTQHSQKKSTGKNSGKKTGSAKSKNEKTKSGQSGKQSNASKSGSARKQSAKSKNAKTKSGKSASQIRQEKKQAEEEVRKTQQQLKFNRRLTEKHLNDLELVEGEIGDCNRRIGNITGRIDSLDRRIGVVSDSIATLDNRLSSISKNYARALRKTQGRGQQTSMMAFVFSSESFAEAYRRMNSVKQFDKWRRNKESEIGSVRKSLDDRRLSLTGLQNQNRQSRRELGSERSTLQKKQAETARLVDSLKNRSAELDQIMGDRARQAAQLDAELDNLIAAEARAKAEAKRKAEEEARRRAEAEAKARAEAEAKARADAEERARVQAEERERAAQAKARDEAEAKARREKDAADRKAAEKTGKVAKEAAGATKGAKNDVPPPPARKSATEKKNDVPESRNVKGVKHKGRDNAAKENKKPSDVPPPPKRETPRPAAEVPPRPAQTATGTTAPRLQSATTAYATGTVDAKAPVVTGTDFGSMQGSLMFPVTGRYTIVKRFGRHKHPTLPHIETTNSGLDIQTQPKAPVRAVFDGEVSAIFRPDGFNNVVVVRHGDYLTVYANLGQISVSAHQRVKAGQTIGTVYANPDDDGRSVLHFEIRHGRDKQDPEAWLRR